jgi:hypothetical protein
MSPAPDRGSAGALELGIELVVEDAQEPDVPGVTVGDGEKVDCDRILADAEGVGTQTERSVVPPER